MSSELQPGRQPGARRARSRSTSDPASSRWWASIAGDDCRLAGLLDRRRRRGGAGRAGGSARAGPGSPDRSGRAAWPGGRRRPRPAARRRRRRRWRRAARRRRARWPPPSTGSVAAGPATAARLRTCTDDGIEAVEAQADHRPDRLRQVAADGAVGVADQLGEEEGVAAGGGAQLGRAGRRRARSSAAARRPRRGPQAADGARASSSPSRASPAATRSSSGVGSSAGTRTVATTITRPGSSWRRTCSIIFSDGASAHCRSSRTISIGCIGRLGAQQLGDGLEQQVALDARDRGARTGPRARAGRARAAAAAAGRARRRPGAGPPGTPCAAPCARPRPSARTGRSPRPSPGPTARCAPTLVDLGGEAGGQPRLAGAGLPDEQGEVAAAGRGSSTRGRAAGPSCSSRPTNSPAPARSGRAGQRPRATAGCGAGAACRAARVGRRRRGRRRRRRATPCTAGAARSGSWLRIAVCSSDELGRRIEAELVGEHGARARVHAQRVGLAAAAVQGDHQAAGEPLAQRVLVGRALQLADRLAVAAEGEQGVEAGLQRLQPQLVPAHGGRPGPLLVGDVGEDRTVPLGQARLEVDERRARDRRASAARASATRSSKRAASKHVAGRRPARSRAPPGAAAAGRRAPGAAARRSSAAC